jgi:hypothetical protein
MEHTTIDLRKTFARVVYFIEQLEAGKSKTAILQELDFKEEEWQFLLSRMIEISEYRDQDAIILLPDGRSSTLGPILLASENILKLII